MNLCLAGYCGSDPELFSWKLFSWANITVKLIWKQGCRWGKVVQETFLGLVWQRLVVPGHHEMVLDAKFKGAECHDGMLGIVEPSPGFTEQQDLVLHLLAPSGFIAQW